MNRFKVVYFDMDGTLIRNTNSVQYLCTLNGNYDGLMKIEKMEDNNEVSWVEADFLKSELIKGLHQDRIIESFDKEISLITGINDCLIKIKELGMKAVLITAGPIDVAYALTGKFAFDAVYGSEYEVVNKVYTGKIIKHLDSTGKLNGLKDFCQKNNANLKECLAVGDSASDIDVFENCGKRIAINYSKALFDKADEYLVTEDLRDILCLIT